MQRKIRIHRANVVPVEAAPGVIATRIVRPKFGTATVDGKTVVTQFGL